MPAANDPQGPVRGALDALHRAFGAVPRPRHLTGCSCCAGRVDLARLLSAPRESLTAADLDLYATKAITTVGTPDDFQWFLPRLLGVRCLSDRAGRSDVVREQERCRETPGAYPKVREDVSQTSDAAPVRQREGLRREKDSGLPELLLTGELAVDVEIVQSKLALSGFHEWAPELRIAVEEVLWAELLRRCLNCPSEVDEWLCGIALATRTLAPWLQRLDAMDSVGFRAPVARMRMRLGSEHRASAFWEGAGDELSLLRAWGSRLPRVPEPLYEEPGLFVIERSTTGALWMTVDRERGAGVVETIRRALTDVEARELAEGDLHAARALAWAVHDGRS